MSGTGPARRSPAWLTPGPDTCGFCLHGFCIEIAYHCGDCDRPVCPACAVVVRARGVVLCPQCDAAPEAAGGAGSDIDGDGS